MFKRLRTTWMAGSGALLLVLALSGVVAGASFLAATGPAQETADPEVVDTTATWEDTNGNGTDDDCEEAVVADPDAEALAETAVDTDGDGVISVTEAAHSDRVGGKNCNHGGFVSFVAHGDEACDEAETTDPEADADPDAIEAGVTGPVVTEPEPEADAPEACVEPTDEDAEETADEADQAECEEVAAPEPDETLTNHGAWISLVAQSDAIGGKNCNHGGAVSDANKAAKEARDAAKAAQAAERDAAKAERKADRDAAKAERDAAKAERNAARTEKAAKPAKTNSKGH